MCHRFTICSYNELERIVREISGDPTKETKDKFDFGKTVFPGMRAPVLVAERRDAQDKLTQESFEQGRLFDVEIEDYMFGWPVEWKKGTVFNTRFESLLEGKHMWKDAFENGRCILPVESFCESQTVESGPSNKESTKQQFSFASADGSALLLAAISNEDSFSIVTIEAKDEVAKIHERMPLVLTFEEAKKWLDPSIPLDALKAIANRDIVTRQDDKEQFIQNENFSAKTTLGRSPLVVTRLEKRPSKNDSDTLPLF